MEFSILKGHKLPEAKGLCVVIDVLRAFTTAAFAFASGAKEIINIDEKDFTGKIMMDYSSLYEEKGDDFSEYEKDATHNTSKDDEEEERYELDIENVDINIVFHEPARVVKLQSEIYPVCFGYLVFPRQTVNSQAAMQMQTVDAICKSILQSLEKKIPRVKGIQNTKELKDILATMVANTSREYGHINIRYVSPDKMQHFMVPSTKYYPYGESIFDSMQYTAKVLIALETALAIQRLSRSTEKRKIAVEMGLPRDAKKLVEKLREEMSKRKVSLDSFGSVDTIPSMITTFEDIYIPQKDGKAFVDISTFTEGNVDIRSKVDELKFLRDQLVASIGIPPAFIGIEENSVVKATLAEENILFARTIVSKQKFLTHQIVNLLEKVIDIIAPDEGLVIFDNITVALPIPRSLQFEREAKYMNEVSTLIETLERIGIPKEYSKRRYLTGIDWQEVEKYKVEGDIDEKLSTDGEDDEMGGAGGMGGGGMGF